MATYYSQGSGNWSAPANWNTSRTGSGSAPASVAAMDGNAFVIQATHVIVLDLLASATSGWSGLTGITIEGAASGVPGTLQLSTISGSYYLPMKSSIAGTSATVLGRFYGGSADTPLPAGAVHVIAQLATSGYLVNATYLDMQMHCAPPLRAVYTLASAATAAATTLTLTEDPSAEVEWRAGWEVRVSEVRAATSTAATLAATPVGSYTLNLAAALGAAKSAGATVALTQRNIEFRVANGGVGTNCIYGGAGTVLSCAVRQTAASVTGAGIASATNISLQDDFVLGGFSNGVQGGSGIRLCGRAVIVGCANGLCYYGESYVMDDYAQIMGCSYALLFCHDVVMQGAASISCCMEGARYATLLLLQEQATIKACSVGLQRPQAELRGVTLGGAGAASNNYDVCGGRVKGYGAELASSTQVGNYLRTQAYLPARVTLWDNGGAAARYPKLWCAGGRGDSCLTTAPSALDPTLTESLQLILEQSSTATSSDLYAPCSCDFPLYFPQGIQQQIVIYARKDTTALTAEPQALLLDPDTADWPTEPTPLASVTAADLLDEWQVLRLAYTEPVRSRTLTLRLQATHASGNVWFAFRPLGVYPWRPNFPEGVAA